MPGIDPAEVLAREPALGLLELAVPMWIERVRELPDDRRIELARECADTIAHKGDLLMFRGKKGESAGVFNDLARGLAALACQPGGVSFASMHWCTAACHGCHDTGAVWPPGSLCNCDPGPEGQHHPYCGSEPCPRGCEVPPDPDRPKRRGVEDVELP